MNLKKKLIIFNVIGSKEYGLGHIYRCLTIAKSLNNNTDFIFFCHTKYKKTVLPLIPNEYMKYSGTEDILLKKILKLKPDLLINDILDTSIKYMNILSSHNITLLNFEDFGNGNKKADLVINELFEKPTYKSNNTLWGHKYFLLRDEFTNIKKLPKFENKISNILISFGGTDPNDFTRKFLNIIAPICKINNISISLVTGPGYLKIKQLQKDIKKLKANSISIEYIHHTGKMSTIMKKSQLAITSNGRTTYELAHMNLQSIIISHHKREDTHTFTKKNEGFIHLGCYEKRKTEKKITKSINCLIIDNDRRKKAFNALKKIKFESNRQRVIYKIEKLINK